MFLILLEDPSILWLSNISSHKDRLYWGGYMETLFDRMQTIFPQLPGCCIYKIHQLKDDLFGCCPNKVKQKCLSCAGSQTLWAHASTESAGVTLEIEWMWAKKSYRVTTDIFRFYSPLALHRRHSCAGSIWIDLDRSVRIKKSDRRGLNPPSIHTDIFIEFNEGQ